MQTKRLQSHRGSLVVRHNAVDQVWSTERQLVELVVRDGAVQRRRRIAWENWEEKITMPKMKTNKQAKRRFKITGTGKVMRAKGGKSHLRRKKSKRTRRMFDKMHEVAPQDEKRIKRLLPYGLK